MNLPDVSTLVSNCRYWLKVFADIKLMSFSLLAVFILYQVLYESVWLAEQKHLSEMNEKLQHRKTEFESKTSELNKYQLLQTQLKDLPVRMEYLKEGDSPQVKAVYISSQLKKLIDGSLRHVSPDEPTPSPHNTRTLISFESKGHHLVNLIDLAQELSKDQQAAPSPPPPPQNNTSKTEGAQPPAPPPAQPAVKEHINAWQFLYEIKVEGTYIALADLLNQIALSPSLLSIQELELKPAQVEQAQEPEQQVPLHLRLVCAIYLYDPTVQDREPTAAAS
jgi:Tfp pilus assembly protein PilO